MLTGKIINGSCIGNVYEPGIKNNYITYLPEVPHPEPLALYLFLEANQTVILPLMEQLMREELIPWGVLLLVEPGALEPPAGSVPEAAQRRMRAEQFDQFGREYADYLVAELIPSATAALNVELDPSPDRHFITGGSSGGLCAWNVAWFRNDMFRRVFLSSPTFAAMRGGEEVMVLCRKMESRPIRIYMTVGTDEPDYYFGNSFYAACNAAKAFDFAGYDYRFEVFSGEGHCARREDPALLRRVMSFLWANWQTEPVTVLGKQVRIRQILPSSSCWIRCDTGFPEPQSVMASCSFRYTFEEGRIFLDTGDASSRREVAGGFGRITALVRSSDWWRLYIADESRRAVFAMTIGADGSLSQRSVLSMLHLKHDCVRLGAADLCVDQCDRVYAATELGIQCIVSFGLTDAILPLPDDLPAERVAIRRQEGKHWLYVSSGTQVFRRELRSGAGDASSPASPTTPEYGDDFSYCLSHLPQ